MLAANYEIYTEGGLGFTVAYIYIHEESGSNLSEYQVLVNLNASNFNYWQEEPCIRIRQGSILCSYWAELWDQANKQAKIWVRVPSIPANSTVCLGILTSSYSTSNVEATFDFFDDFDDNSINTSKWVIDHDGSPAITETNGVLRVGGNVPIPKIRSLKNFSNYALEGKVRMTGTSTQDEWIFDIAYKDEDNLYDHRHAPGHPTTSQQHRMSKKVDGSWTDIAYVGYTTADTDWHKFTAIVLDSGLKKIDFEDLPDLEATDTSLTSPFTFRLGGTTNSGHYVEYDYVRVRKYISPEPTVTVVPA